MRSKFYNNHVMKSFGLGIVLTFAFITNAISQTPHNCGSEMDKLIKENPNIIKSLELFMMNYDMIKKGVDDKSFERASNNKYVIPVVVHILHTGGSENINRSQIVSQITATNRDLAMMNTGLAGISSFPAFDSLVPRFSMSNNLDSFNLDGLKRYINKVEFRLATKDPLGNCSDGITRTYTPKADEADNRTLFKSVKYWDRARYFNLWIVKTIYTTESTTTLGYAQFPFFGLSATDGVAVIHNFFGTTGTAASGTGATTTHEVGHWLGLRHIWGDADCGSDGISDTPTHKEPNFCGSATVCPPPLPKIATCITDTNSTDTALNAINLEKRNEIGEMWMDFMDYTSDDYLWMFTREQYLLMNTTLQTITFRNSLHQSSNLVATGTDDASQASPCAPAPISDLYSLQSNDLTFTKELICAGGSVTFTNGTYNVSSSSAVAPTYTWDFPGGSPATSTSTSPSAVTYANVGSYDVSLTATNPSGSDTETKDDFVVVLPTTADYSSWQYYDDFEYAGSYYDDNKWMIINEGNQVNGWERVGYTGYLSSKCMKMVNDENVMFEKDFLVSPAFDLTTISSDRLYFQYSYARKTDNPFIEVIDDVLEVYVSTNCGQDWTKRNITADGTTSGSLTGTRLNTAGLVPDDFIPNSPTQWKQGSVDLASVSSSNNVRVMFVWTAGGEFGNSMYLDRINIGNSTSIGLDENPSDVFQYAIYPNPVSSTSQIYFNIPTDSKVAIDVMDVAGKLVGNIFTGNLNAGQQVFDLSKSQYNAAGVYLVRLTVNGVSTTKKVIIE